jgi:resolvase-like protein
MKSPSVKTVRCAIYTRVSTEHGLDQEFNSLDAQYEAASAYIKSQAHAGWTLIRARYDDGGYSGGSTDRPDLQRLLDDIRARKIDVIVVYKVKRVGKRAQPRVTEVFQKEQDAKAFPRAKLAEALLEAEVLFQTSSPSPTSDALGCLDDQRAVSVRVSWRPADDVRRPNDARAHRCHEGAQSPCRPRVQLGSQRHALGKSQTEAG